MHQVLAYFYGLGGHSLQSADGLWPLKNRAFFEESAKYSRPHLLDVTRNYAKLRKFTFTNRPRLLDLCGSLRIFADLCGSLRIFADLCGSLRLMPCKTEVKNWLNLTGFTGLSGACVKNRTQKNSIQTCKMSGYPRKTARPL
jgi:hypothetical protein